MLTSSQFARVNQQLVGSLNTEGGAPGVHLDGAAVDGLGHAVVEAVGAHLAGPCTTQGGICFSR